MPVSADTLRMLLAAGLTGDALVEVVASIDADHASAPKTKTAAAIRQERYRDRKAASSVTRDVTRDVSDDAEVSPKKETSPAPLKEKTTPSTTEPNGSSKTRAARLTADWVLPFDWRADAIKAGLPPDRIDLEAEKMRDWSISSPNGAKREWRAAWRNWVKSAADKLPRGSPSFSKHERTDHFANHTRELIDGQDRSRRSDSRDWDDAQGVPILAIDYERR